MGAVPMTMAPVAPACPPAAHTVAIVGDTAKVDKWSEYTDDKTGHKYYHNPAKPNETTWDKPKDFDKQKMAGQPAPPDKAKLKKKKPKYTTGKE